MAYVRQEVKIRQKKPDGRTTTNPSRAAKTMSGPQYKTCSTCGGTGRVRK